MCVTTFFIQSMNTQLIHISYKVILYKIKLLNIYLYTRVCGRTGKNGKTIEESSLKTSFIFTVQPSASNGQNACARLKSQRLLVKEFSCVVHLINKEPSPAVPMQGLVVRPDGHGHWIRLGHVNRHGDVHGVRPVYAHDLLDGVGFGHGHLHWHVHVHRPVHVHDLLHGHGVRPGHDDWYVHVLRDGLNDGDRRW